MSSVKDTVSQLLHHNKAAWLSEKGARLHVDKTDLPTPSADEIIIKNHAVAINPIDWKLQDYGLWIQSWPTILGQDVAGEVYAVGENVTKFKKGDRVLSHLQGAGSGDLRAMGFQLYSAASTTNTALLPSSISFTQGSVLPVAISTAATGLYQPRSQGFLGLPQPSLNPTPLNETIIVYGGSSSVGSLAIQLAVASGANVIAIASSHNHAYVKQLGAAAAVDYKSPTIVEDTVRAVEATGGKFVGIYDAISVESSYAHDLSILEKLGGGNLAVVLTAPENAPDNVKIGSIYSINPVTHPVWESYVTPALEQGKLKAVPEPLVVGKGLEAVQHGLDVNKKGVSAKKVVVEL